MLDATGSLELLEKPAQAVETVIRILIDDEVLTTQALARGRRAAEQSLERLDLVLNKLGLVSDHALAAAWSAVTGLPIAEPTAYPPHVLLGETLEPGFLAHARALPLKVDGDRLELAVVDAVDHFTPAAIAAKTGLSVSCKLARPGEFSAAFERLYGAVGSADSDEISLGADAALTHDVERLRDLASDAPVVRMVNGLIDRAIEVGASDLHISAARAGLRVRYRIDGILRDVEPPPGQFHAAVISRLKIMAGLDIAERRLPQDGRIRIAWRGREIDLRIATMPHLNGEGAVLRVLDRSAVSLDFEALGFSASLIASFHRILSEPHGIFLVTGPTGSGKTTTLYAALQAIASPERNIVTVEDPTEYQLEGVNQIQVNRKIGLDFASALRAVLRQDPDVIMVGEIRDRETAIVANQAALTGHLVLATVHTNTAVAALPRLVDMGVEPYLLASTIKGSMAQRLVRRLCPHCRRSARPEPWHQGLWRGRSTSLQTCHYAVGCERCQGTGYIGRIAIAESMPMTDAIKGKLLEKADERELAATAQSAGMMSMVEDGLSKVAAGLTSVDELLRAVGAS
ncbi:GspE/PulE family protein [Microvirga terricola]|uniref:Flp pilus assembly complex ATPase component TadA n=1 Tax=Microvirga terricola TaxID=2719797 RepID=A0ABX0VFV3_9HYPH|nr:ATPase, T2SS/T4P/T4SS family [Microvirga terricola]NIX78431.1 Flp pilus assembly complex ATPase component TadA [Microvirga terricola]